MHRRMSLVCAAAVLLCGCGGDIPIFCIDVRRYGLQLEIRDAQTGRPAVAGSSIVVSSGLEVDSLRVATAFDSAKAIIELAENARSGQYTLRVHKPLYHSIQVDNLQINEDECGPLPTKVMVQLYGINAL